MKVHVRGRPPHSRLDQTSVHSARYGHSTTRTPGSSQAKAGTRMRTGALEALNPATRGWKEGIWENQDGKRTQPLQPLHYGEANDSETLGHLVAFPDCPRTPTTEV